MSAAVVNTVHEHRLTLAEILGWLVEDGQVGQPEADVLLKESRLNRLVAMRGCIATFIERNGLRGHGRLRVALS